MKRFGGDKKYLYWGVTAFAVIACSIVFYMLISRWPGVAKGLSALMHIIAPFIWGFAITYLLRPGDGILRAERDDPAGRQVIQGEPPAGLRFQPAIAIVIAELLMLFIVGALLWLILPQIYLSINNIGSRTARAISRR